MHNAYTFSRVAMVFALYKWVDNVRQFRNEGHHKKQNWHKKIEARSHAI